MSSVGAGALSALVRAASDRTAVLGWVLAQRARARRTERSIQPSNRGGGKYR
jgi:hypothetical protein